MSSSPAFQFKIEAVFGSDTTNTDKLAQMARVSEAAERYEDMCTFMSALVKAKKTDLTIEERNLLSVAFKNVIGSRRASWRTLNAELSSDDNKDAPPKHLVEYRTIIENELEAISTNVIGLLSENLLPMQEGTGSESEVFYRKMAGDYNRYMAEILPAKSYHTAADTHYAAATTVAEAKLTPTHPIRLGLALNYSVCQYEILKNPKGACTLAKKAFDDAISKLDQLDESSYKDSTLIMQLLRDNLTLWTSDTGDEE